MNNFACYCSWSKHFSDAIESFNRREGKSKLKEPFNDDSDSDSERVQDLPPANEVAPERAEAVGGEDQSQQPSNATVSSSSSPKENRTSVAEGDLSVTTKEEQETQQQTDKEVVNISDVTSENRESTTESPSKLTKILLLNSLIRP